MNYRHIYHAGNLGDVLKHAVLAAIITYLKKKEGAFRVFDTHAGVGLYDLTSEQAQKTGEWHHGIGRIIDAEIPKNVAQVLDPWLSVVRDLNPQGGINLYPGSPVLARDLMRNQDRLTLTELHPEEFDSLITNFGGDKHVKLIEIDAWLALGSFLPPKERRGLVLIDPAYEVESEFDRLLEGIHRGWKRWQTGIYAMWYPIKNRRVVNRLIKEMESFGIRNVLSLELGAGQIREDKPMSSSGMLIVNPPWTLKADMDIALPWLCERLSRGPGAHWHAEVVIDE